MPPKNALSLPSFASVDESEWQEFYGDLEFPNAVVNAFMQKGWTADIAIARGFYTVLDESTQLLDSDNPEVIAAKILPLLVKLKNSGAALDDFDKFNELIDKKSVDETAAETLHEMDKLPSSDLKVKEIEITVFNKYDGAILDKATNLPYAVSVQLRDQDVAFGDIPSGVANLLFAAVNAVNDIVGYERFTINPAAFPKEDRRQSYPQNTLSQQKPSSQPTAPPPRSPSSHQSPGNTQQNRAAPPNARSPQTQQKSFQPQGGNKAFGGQAKKNIPPQLRTVNPENAEIWDYDAIEVARNEATAKLKDGQQLVECYAIKRLFTKDGSKSGLSFCDYTGKQELFGEFDNSTPGDSKTLFQNPFWKLDKGGYLGNGQVTSNSLLHYLWNMEKGELVFFPQPLFLAVTSTGKSTYIAERLNSLNTWSDSPFYSE